MLIHTDMASPEVISLFKAFPNVRLANHADGELLARFVNETSMSAGTLRIGFTRGHDYFSLMNLQGEKYAALVCEEHGRIVGVGAVTFRRASVRGKTKTVGYLQDLRVSGLAHHKTRIQFYQCFSELVRLCPRLPEFDYCSVLLTAILDENHPAKAALSRSSFPLEYTRLSGYEAHVWPKASVARVLRTHQDARPDPKKEELLKFYQDELGRSSFDLTLNDIERLLGHAQTVVLREQDKIVAACLLVQTEKERQLRSSLRNQNYSFEHSGTYITALRLNRRTSSQQEDILYRRLINQAWQQSLKLPGIFTGLITAAGAPFQLSWLQNLFCINVKGSLYRVYHPEHTQLADFSDGFLRPNHVPALEWVLM